VLDAIGGLLAVAEFPTTSAGHRELLAWLSGFGPVARVGVEGTGSYGAELTRFLWAAGVQVVEVTAPTGRPADGPESPTCWMLSRRPGQRCLAGLVGRPSPRTGTWRRSGRWCGQAVSCGSLGEPGVEGVQHPTRPLAARRTRCAPRPLIRHVGIAGPAVDLECDGITLQVPFQIPGPVARAGDGRRRRRRGRP